MQDDVTLVITDLPVMVSDNGREATADYPEANDIHVISDFPL